MSTQLLTTYTNKLVALYQKSFNELRTLSKKYNVPGTTKVELQEGIKNKLKTLVQKQLAVFNKQESEKLKRELTAAYDLEYTKLFLNDNEYNIYNSKQWEQLSDLTEPYVPTTSVKIFEKVSPMQIDEIVQEIDKARNKLDSKLPTNYPYYVQTTVTLKLHDETTQRIMTFVSGNVKVTALTRAKFIKTVAEKMFDEYKVKQNGEISAIDLKIIYPNGKQKLINVRKHYMGNCFINIIKDHPKSNVIYKALPHLKPTDINTNPEISPDDINTLSKKLKCKFTIYSKLGAKLNQPWQEFGTTGKGRHYHIVFNDDHAQLHKQKFKIDEIQYVNIDVDLKDFTDVVDEISMSVYPTEEYIYNQNPNIPTRELNSLLSKKVDILYGYVRFINGKFVMFKEFRPSTITNDPSDDKKTAYVYCINSTQLLAKIFKKTIPIITDPDIKNLIKQSEHFITKTIFKKPTVATKILDANKCYISYKNSPYYIGFPKNDLYPVRGDHINATFQVVTLSNLPESFHLLGFKENQTVILPRPVINYLKQYSTVLTQYSIVSGLEDIDIIEWSNQYKDRIPSNDLKLFRNTVIGYTIAGGIAETKKLNIKFNTEAEMNQIIYECDVNDLTFKLDDQHICVDYKVNSNALFQFHSYILGYSMIKVASKMQELIENGSEIIGYNVDAILYNENNQYVPTELGYDIGQWKFEDITKKPYYLASEPNEHKRYDVNIPTNLLNLRNEIPVNTVINGPGGIGKSYEYLTNPFYDSIFLTYTKKQRDESRSVSKIPVHTAAKYFQFTLSQDSLNLLRNRGTIPRRYAVIIVDEFMMFNRQQWKHMRKQAALDGSVIIALGDIEQICNEINSEPISLEYFENCDFNVIHQHRTDKPARHSFAEGTLLDTLRGNPKQKITAQTFLTTNSKDNLQYTQTSMICTDTHKKCCEYNLLAKEIFIKNSWLFPVQDRKGKLLHIDPQDPLIWWDKKKMSDIPKNFKYEPMYAVTSDYLQGTTINNTLYVDTNIMRKGAFYTAVTRTRKLADTILVEL